MQIDTKAQREMVAGLGAGSARGPWKRVVRAVQELAGPHAEFVRHAETPWASVTCSGARHKIGLAFAGADGIEAAETFIAALPDHEFSLSGSIVADATIVSVDHRALPSSSMLIEAELLLLDDA